MAAAAAAAVKDTGDEEEEEQQEEQQEMMVLVGPEAGPRGGAPARTTARGRRSPPTRPVGPSVAPGGGKRRIVTFGAAGRGLRRPRRASKALRRCSGVRWRAPSLLWVDGGRWGAVLRQSRRHFQPSEAPAPPRSPPGCTPAPRPPRPAGELRRAQGRVPQSGGRAPRRGARRVVRRGAGAGGHGGPGDGRAASG